MTFHVELHGIGVDVPDGWEAELAWAGGDRPDPEASADDLGVLAVRTGGRVVAHLANFVLPVDRGDYGSGAVEQMDANAVFVSLMEFEPGGRGGVFSVAGLPQNLRGNDFSPDQLQRRLPGQAGLQRFFAEGDRRFVLYVVVGSYHRRDVLAAEVNRLLRRVTIGA
ncbi:MAG: hypothetical protein AAGC53_07565 [Actinomycetota bacterium]